MSKHFAPISRIGLRSSFPGMQSLLMILMIVLSLVGFRPTSALAAGTTYYVDKTNPACTDTGQVGSMAIPFCTIGRGAYLAQPGQIVHVLHGTYAETVYPERSGTDGNPITYWADPGVTVTGQPQLTVVPYTAYSGFALGARNYIVIDGFNITNTSLKGIYVDASHHVTITNNHVSNAGITSTTHPYEQGIYTRNLTYSTISGNTTDYNTCIGIRVVGGDHNLISNNISYENFSLVETDAAGIELTGSSYNTVINNLTYSNEDSGINLYYWDGHGGSTNNLVIGNLSYENGDHGIDNYQSPNNTIVGNTVQGNGTVGINFEGNTAPLGSFGAIVANNIMSENGTTPPSGSWGGNLRFDANSTAGSTTDYNLFYRTDATVQIIWNNTNYTSLAAFKTAVSGQEVHGLEGNPLFVNPVAPVHRQTGVPYNGLGIFGNYYTSAGSPAIDSANADAPSEPLYDILGKPRVDDPATANTGAGVRTYDDRGAYEFQATPDTTITNQPANPTNSQTATFSFTSTYPTSTFECRLDSGSFSTCTSPKTYTGLSDSSHTFQVRARNTAGIVDPTPASYTWTIDRVAPNTQIDSKPPNPSNITDATFRFSSADTTATFECQLDGGSFSTCTSPKNYTALNNGSHTFAVRAKDAAGNVDTTPASYTWIVTYVPPVSAGTYDDTHAAWSYSGTWTSYSQAGPYNNTDHFTNQQDASAAISFTGTKFTLYFTQYANRGSVDVVVDGVDHYTINQTGSLVWQQSWTLPVLLTNGVHTVQFQNPSADPAAYIDIDAITIVGPVGPGTYDDTHAAWSYSGSWTSYSQAGPYNNTDHFTNEQNASAAITFSGTKFTLYFTQYANRGSVDVVVDGVDHYTIDQTGSLVWQQSWTLPVLLTNGVHTVQFQNPSADPAAYIDIDAITIVGAVGPGTYDDTHAAWSYSGTWTSYSQAGPYNNTDHFTNEQNASTAISFTGTKFTLYFTQYANRGSVDVVVDGVDHYTINQTGSLVWQQSWTLPVLLTNGVHTVQFQNPSADPAAYIDIDAITIVGPVGPGTYDDTHAAWSYSGTWTSYSQAGPYNNTDHFTNQQNASAAITFTGMQFTVYFTQYANRGSVDVVVDGVDHYTINQTGSLVWQQSWTLPVLLTNGVHTVQFKNPSADPAAYIDVDAITILP